ncbi:unnamed protein product [Symbiodinium sp. CCMP2456]|nr:unnamed protein product [Symbiodinium sp. CCMP2456]
MPDVTGSVRLYAAHTRLAFPAWRAAVGSRGFCPTSSWRSHLMFGERHGGGWALGKRSWHALRRNRSSTAKRSQNNKQPCRFSSGGGCVSCFSGFRVFLCWKKRLLVRRLARTGSDALIIK